MKNYRPVIKNALKGIETDIPFRVKMAFPESTNDGNIISYYELTNNATSIPTVDDIAFQVDLWTLDLEELFTLADLVDDALSGMGLLRQFASPDSMLHDPSGYLRKSLRYGRRVETLTNRLVD